MPQVLTQGRVVVTGDFVTSRVIEFRPDGEILGYKLSYNMR